MTIFKITNEKIFQSGSFICKNMKGKKNNRILLNKKNNV